jgi:hypothetical protein
MITEKQYLETIAKENAEALAKYYANGGGVTVCKPGVPDSIQKLKYGYGFMVGKRRWVANISERNRLSKGLNLNDMHAKMPRPDSFV